MKRAIWNGKEIEAGPDAPARATCPYCDEPVLLRSRRNMDGCVTWYWRHETGAGRHCPGRSMVPGSTFWREVDDGEE
jgi:hypothetical protein